VAATAGEDEDGLISGINVTPLVDVILVLLIIFMVTARIIHSQGMPMDLPKAAKGEQVQTIFSVELTADKKTFVDSKQLQDDDAILELAKSAFAKNKELRAVIRADKKVEHGRVIHVLDLLKRTGIAKIAFAVSPIENEASPLGGKPAAGP
jgi:biopolymer transport protein ExbD